MTAAIISLILGVLRILLPVLLERTGAEDARCQPALKRKLHDSIRRTWGVLLIALLLTGCTWTRTVYVPPGEPVRIREDIRGAKVWVMGADGRPVAGEIDIPEGWYALPPPQD